MTPVVVSNSHRPERSASAKPLLSLRLFTFSLVLLLTSLVAAGMMSGCRTADPTSPNNNNEQPLVRTTVVGTVVDEAGLPVAGAAVTAHGQTTTSDKNGYFVMQNVNAPKDRCVALAKMNGYFTAAKADITKENGLTQIKLFLMSHGTRKSVSGIAGGKLTINSTSGTASLKFEPNGLVTTGGSAFNGDAQVAVRHLDPADPTFAYYFAGDQAAVRENGDRTDLVSYGVLRVDIRSASGEQLQPAAGKPAEITYPIPANMLATAPASIPLWFFDEQKGLWVEEGVATKQGSSYIGTVKHFTDWNADTPKENNADLVGVVLCNGVPMPGVFIRIGQTSTYSDQDGRFFRYVPMGIDLDVIVEPAANQGLYGSDLQIVPMLSSRERREITIHLTSNCPTTVVGTLTDDEDRPIPGHVEWINEGGQVTSASTLDGKFYLRVPSNSTIDFEATSWSCIGGKSFTVSSGDAGEATEVGNFKVCSAGQTTTGDIDVSTFKNPVYATLSPDGARVAINGNAPVVVVRNSVDGQLVSTATLGGGTYHNSYPPTYSKDGSHLSVYDYYQQQVIVFDVASGNKLCSLRANGMILPDGNSVLTISGDSSQTPPHMARHSVATGEEIQSYALDVKKLGYVLIAGITADGSRAVLVTRTSIIVYDLVNDAVISDSPTGAYQLYTNGVWSISADGSILSMMAVSANKYMTALLNTQTGAVIQELPTLGAFNPGVISPDGTIAVVQDSLDAGSGLSPRLVNVSNGAEIRRLTTDGEPGRYTYFSFSADGKRLSGVYLRKGKTMIRIWDL